MAAPRNYTIAWEPLSAIMDNTLANLLVQNYEEMEADHEAIPLDPDWPRAFALEDMGVLRIMVLRCNGEIVGYNAFHVMPYIHAKGATIASNDVIYVAPEHRARTGVLLIKTAEKALKAAGVARIHYGTKSNPVVGRAGHKTGDLLAKLGYRHDEEMYSKLL